MIDKITKGNRVAGLVYYLYGPGKSNEHRDPHLVAGWRPPGEIEPGFRTNGTRDFRDLVNQLNAPLDALGINGGKNTVWQCALSAAGEDPLLSDEQWNRIATEFMDKMGFATQDDPAGVRWVAVRHGLSKDGYDHIHIVATLARQDGGLPDVYNDYRRARKACQEIEKQFGLRATASADCTAAPRPSRAETEQARRSGLSEPPRIMLRRIVQDAAATAASEDDFLARIRDSGALVRTRNSTEQPGKTIGYAVALPAGQSKTGKEIWFGGGKLAPDLTLPKLRHRWTHSVDSRPYATTPANGLDARTARAFLRSAACSAAERSRNEGEFFRRLDDAGVLVKLRYSELHPGEITGYSLALPGHADENGDLAWYSGGRLSEKLTMPRLQQRWNAGDRAGRLPAALSPAERNAIWSDVIRLTGEGADELRRLATTDPAGASDAAWATADALRASATALGGTPGRQIRRAATDFDRAARQTYRTIPGPTAAGNGLRTASRLLAMVSGTGSRGVRIDQLLISLIQLAEETARLRLVQMRNHQAAAARGAAESLSAMRRDEALRQRPPAREATAVGARSASGPPKSATRVARADIPAVVRLRPPVPAQRQAPQPVRSSLNQPTRPRKSEGPAP